ncbi:hypothetical protein AVEN_166146-1 [Araneus ventricosus]|uniref:Reverse transcriptase/retrotransposon-derived protein RNase H-like domain-containing protein n=1 Tax=Araneus ventricosus TaxID=182803 RepID=A0A4Y2RW30_ARAVE|nr:hypothetical protein AVEN_166146-1 [Araneus ventricosus]
MRSFEKCKNALINATLLRYNKPELPLSLCTDASDWAVDREDKKENPQIGRIKKEILRWRMKKEILRWRMKKEIMSWMAEMEKETSDEGWKRRSSDGEMKKRS